MSSRLFLLDGMALVYRAHFALIRTPIFNSKRINTSALFGFTNTLLDITEKHQPTHLAVIFDTDAPTPRHLLYPAYKAQREEMPEELSAALPEVRRLLEAWRIPVIAMDGFEADDLIGTLAKQAEQKGFETYMVTPDKDFGQLVSDKIKIFKPGRQGGDTEILGVPEVCERWGIERVEQVIDVLGLMGDVSDNIPGIPGFGEKTAAKLIAQFGSIEKLIASVDQLKGRQQERVKQYGDQALLSKKLATLITDAPVGVELDSLKRVERNEEALKALFVEFEFNSLGKRLFGPDFKAGRGFSAEPQASEKNNSPEPEPDLFSGVTLKTITDVPHSYRLITTAEQRRELIVELGSQTTFCFDTETDSLDPKARLLGIAFSWKAHHGCYVALPSDPAVLEEFRCILENPTIEKTGHHLKFDLGILLHHGIRVAGPFVDTMIAHALIDPGSKHGMDALSERYLGYTPIPITRLIGEKGQTTLSLAGIETEKVAEYAAEDADVTWQLREKLLPQVTESGQDRVFREVECPLLPVLASMEQHGIALDRKALAEFGNELAKEIAASEARVLKLAGTSFNLNSPRQLGQVLFDILQLDPGAKKTKTGQYKTDEATLETLAAQHPIVRELLNYRSSTKLKSTYVDALPESVHPITGRIHTTYNQAVTSTGRLNSQDPNLQNIPIRSEQGKEIRKAFIPQEGFLLLSADYSQIELRIMAELSGDAGLREAFENGEDIHSATAAKVYGLPLAEVTGEMRRNAKMVNFGIIYGISAFGLAQRLGIPRGEAAGIIEQYFAKYPGVKKYMEETIAFARKNGFVETMTGRRRVLRDINSANGTLRQATERTAINTPIQGTAADMIKIAMARIHSGLIQAGHTTRMLLQVHDELVFELHEPERKKVEDLIQTSMKTALPMKTPIVVEIGVGRNWLEAH